MSRSATPGPPNPFEGLHPLDQLVESLRATEAWHRWRTRLAGVVDLVWDRISEIDVASSSRNALRRSREALNGVGSLGQLMAVVLSSALVMAAAGGMTLTAVANKIPAVDLALDEVPDLAEVTERQASLPSVVLAADGSVIGRFAPPELHFPVSPDDLPETVVDAVVAAEDSQFFRHNGIDWSAVGRAVIANLDQGEIDQGGSTITQQLVKNVFTDGERSVERKVRELVVAQQIEREHSKEEILAAYLNTVFFGEHAIGIGAAAHAYFDKRPAELTLSEAALLAGIIPSPTTLNPRENPEGAEARRLDVLDQIAEAELAAPADVQAARDAPPRLQEPVQEQDALHPYFSDYVRRWLVGQAELPAQQIFSGGLRIQTTIDPALQAEAERAVFETLPDPNGPDAALVVIDNATGHVKALVGGRSWEESKVNLALGSEGGGTGRQPGSSFKPFVLAAAMEAGMSLHDMIPAPAEYVPNVMDAQAAQNYTEQGYGEVSIADATAKSINTAYLGLTEKLGAPQVSELASRLGIADLPEPKVVGPSVGIGAYESSPLRMAAAFASFARDGARLSPTPVARVEDRNGNVLAEHVEPQDGEQVISPDSARLVTSALEGVIGSGTGTAANLGRPAAGKTGTSDNYENAWFVGYTPQFTTAVWVGYPEGNIPMHDVAGVANVTGGSLPAAIWRQVMTATHLDVPAMAFPPAPDRPSSTTSTTAESAESESSGPKDDGGGGDGDGKPGKGNGRGDD